MTGTIWKYMVQDRMRTHKKPEVPVIYHYYIACVSGDRSKQYYSIYLGTVTI